jgi:hypothetical protein
MRVCAAAAFTVGGAVGGAAAQVYRNYQSGRDLTEGLGVATAEGARDGAALALGAEGAAAIAGRLAGGSSQGVAGSGRVTTEVSTRQNPGRDGGTSRIIRERVDGRTNSVTHQVERNGEIVHQHQRHVGKSGAQRQFPDDWVQYPEINKP